VPSPPASPTTTAPFTIRFMGRRLKKLGRIGPPAGRFTALSAGFAETGRAPGAEGRAAGVGRKLRHASQTP
jgi:hypothetical protein